MNIHKWLPFILMITSLTSLIEVYVLYHWTKYAKKRQFHKAAYIVPWVISGIVIIMALYLNIHRLATPEIKMQLNTLLLISSFWYLPKLLIVPFLLVKDLMKLSKYIIFSLRNKKNNSEKQEIAKKTDKSRRDFASAVGWSMALVPFGLAGYGILRTTNNPQIHRVNLALHKFPANLDNFRIVHISDIHAGSYYSPKQFREIRRIVNLMNPDIVVITGDFVNFRIEELDVIENELSLIKANYGVFGCMGNHDHYIDQSRKDEFIEKLESLGVKMLINSNHSINTGMGVVQLAGVDNSGMSGQDYADFDQALKGLDESNSIIMLCHDPINWDRQVVGKCSIDLMLSGHTHGGQFGFKMFGREISPAGFVYEQVAGLYHKKEHYLYVNRGVGMTGPPFRVGVNPEVTVINLKRALNLA